MLARRPDLANRFAAGPRGAGGEHVGAGAGASERARIRDGRGQNTMLGSGCSCAVCIQLESRRGRSQSERGEARTGARRSVSRWYMICSSPTRRTTRTTFCRPRRFLSTPIFRARTDTTLCSFRSRPSSQSASRDRMCGFSDSWDSGWASHEECFRDTPEEMIRAGACRSVDDGHSTNPGMEHIHSEALEERRPHSAELSSRAGDAAFMPYTSGTLPTPSGKD